MSLDQIIFLVLAGLFGVSAFLMIALVFYIGRTRAKEIDKAVYGFEMPNDSIFFLVMRIPTYGFAFLSKWHAKRSGLGDKINHFDSHFRWPFIAVSALVIFGTFMMIIAVLFKKYAGLE